MSCGLTGHCQYVSWSVYRRPGVLWVDWSLSVCVLVSVQEAWCGLTGHCQYVSWSVYRRPDVG